MKYNFYLANRRSLSEENVPILWCSLKTYYEENSKFSDQWNWGDPWLCEDRSIEEIIAILDQDPPDVFGCSVYVWNEKFMDELASRVKQRWPNCLIVYGGPQCNIKYTDDFFKIKTWVDFVLPSDAYGEIVLKELLDCHLTKDYSLVPYIYYTDTERNKHFSSIPIEKKSFKWPNNIYKSQEKFLLPRLKGKNFISITETSRGCPYKCIYCDWGGGTYTKINKKPYQTVLDELEWLAKNGANIIVIADANFGIMEIDIDIAEYLVELKQKYGYPKLIYIDSSKNHFDRVIKIHEILAKADLLNHYKLPLQTVDDTIKKNIERIDVPFSKQLAGINHLRENFKDLPIKVQIILGLPGMTYQTAKNEINLLLENNLPLSSVNIWMLLPEAPAYDPVMRERFQIKTVNQGLMSDAWILKKGMNPDPGVSYVVDDGLTAESVVETYSYTREDWVKIFLANSLAGAGVSTGINNYLIAYLQKTHGVKPVDIIFWILENYIYRNKFQNQELSYNFSNLVQTLEDWVWERVNKSSIDYHPEFPLAFNPLYFIAFVILTNLKDFYQDICLALAEKFNDDKIVDLGNYLSNAILDLTYNPDVGRTFTVNYNWQNYFAGGPLTFGQYEYIITDTTILLNVDYQDITWHTYKDNWINYKKQYLYQGLGEIHNDKISQTIKLKDISYDT